MLNMSRLSAVCIFLTLMSWLGVNELLLPSEEDTGLGVGRRVKNALCRGTSGPSPRPRCSGPEGPFRGSWPIGTPFDAEYVTGQGGLISCQASQ